MCGVSNARGIASVPGPLKGDENVFGRSNVPPIFDKIGLRLFIETEGAVQFVLASGGFRVEVGRDLFLLCVDREGGQDYIMCR
jgi:hypothetical protein